jgi:photosystem II stability/assembly factor-like uncharacterized protein
MIRSVILATVVAFGVTQADWVSIGPYGGAVYSGAISASNPQTIYLSPRSYPTPLLKTTDAGASWTQTGQLGYFCFGMAVHPTDPNTVIAATGALYRSTNGGTNWTYMSVPGGSYAQCVGYSPLDPQKVVAAGYGYAGYNHYGVYRSGDGGATWDTVGLDTMHYSIGYSICFDPVDPSVIYTGGYTGQPTIVFKSTDAGVTWARESTGFNGYYCYALHCSPLDHNIVLASSYYQGILRSTDAGATWSRVANYSPIYTFAAKPGDEATIYAGTDNALYVSHDTGLTWQPVGAMPTGVWGRTVLATADPGARIYFGSKAGCSVSTDQGTSWTPLLDGVAFAKVQTLTTAAADPNGVWIEYKDDGVYESADNGTTWSRCSDFLSCGNICSIVTDPRDPQVVWALEGSG